MVAVPMCKMNEAKWSEVYAGRLRDKTLDPMGRWLKVSVRGQKVAQKSG